MVERLVRFVSALLCACPSCLVSDVLGGRGYCCLRHSPRRLCHWKGRRFHLNDACSNIARWLKLEECGKGDVGVPACDGAEDLLDNLQQKAAWSTGKRGANGGDGAVQYLVVGWHQCTAKAIPQVQVFV